MMNVGRPVITFSDTGRRYRPRPDATHWPSKKPMPTDQDTASSQPTSKPIPTKGWDTNDWKALAWETTIKSRTPDGKFGPARQAISDCWFLSPLETVMNNQAGRKILAQGIKKVSVQGVSGYHVRFAGLPHDTIFISDQQLRKFLDTYGGDADTRLMELAAERFFSVKGNLKSLCLAYFAKAGQSPAQAQKSFKKEWNWVWHLMFKTPMFFNPMRTGGEPKFAFFMLTNQIPEIVKGGSFTTWDSTVLKFLHKHLTSDTDGSSVAILGRKSPLGDNDYASPIAVHWDWIRTDITRDNHMDPQERTFLTALHKWLETWDGDDRKALASAAANLKLEHGKPERLVNLLVWGRYSMFNHNIKKVQSAVKEFLSGGIGYIGFANFHTGNIYGIDEAQGTFSYSEANSPEQVHTGKLSSLLTAVKKGEAELFAVQPQSDNDQAAVEPNSEEAYRDAESMDEQLKFRTRDGTFGPANQRQGWADSWFLACLAAVANDKDGREKLAHSIQKTRIQGVGGYEVIFAGLPDAKIFVSNKELGKCLDADGGDADTRILELAADRLFSVRGKFKSMCLSYYLKSGQHPEQAQKSFEQLCQDHRITDPLTYNPMRSGGIFELGFFLLAGIDSQTIISGLLTWKIAILRLLRKHLTKDRDGASVVMQGQANPLGDSRSCEALLFGWDSIRTDITSDGKVNRQERAFLQALHQWLKTFAYRDSKALKSAAADLKLYHLEPARLVNKLVAAHHDSEPFDSNRLQSGVTDLLSGGTGYIGFGGGHSGTLHGIDEARDTFTYTDPKYSKMVYTGKLSDLITAIQQKAVKLQAAEPKIDEADKVKPKTYEEYKDEQDLLEQLKLRTLDGKFGPARQSMILSDSWFLACLTAVAKDAQGRKKLAQSIEKTRVEGVSGYHVTFAGLPDTKIFISDEVLQNCLDIYGGDGDTRLMELAAARFFSQDGNFKALCLASYLKAGQNADQAEASFKQFCRVNSIQKPMTYNPMYDDGGPHTDLGFFLLAGRDSKLMTGSFFTWERTIRQFLYQYISKNPDGAAVVINGRDHPLGKGHDARDLVVGWDAIRTDITSDGIVNQQEQTFLQALDQWLETNQSRDFKVLTTAAADLTLQHVKLDKFLYHLSDHRPDMQQQAVNILRNAVRQVSAGAAGYIGFAGGHAGIIHGIKTRQNTFTYSEPYFPTMVHTGRLSDLMTAIKYKYASLRAVDQKNRTPEDPNDEL